MQPNFLSTKQFGEVGLWVESSHLSPARCYVLPWCSWATLVERTCPWFASVLPVERAVYAIKTNAGIWFSCVHVNTRSDSELGPPDLFNRFDELELRLNIHDTLKQKF